MVCLTSRAAEEKDTAHKPDNKMTPELPWRSSQCESSEINYQEMKPLTPDGFRIHVGGDCFFSCCDAALSNTLMKNGCYDRSIDVAKIHTWSPLGVRWHLSCGSSLYREIMTCYDTTLLIQMCFIMLLCQAPPVSFSYLRGLLFAWHSDALKSF